ncbi:MAG: calcium-binding protein, partial [Nitrosomonas sp.]
YQIDLATDHAVAEISDKGGSGIDEVRFATTVASTLNLFAGDVGIERVVIGTGINSSAITTGTLALNINASAMLNPITMIGNSGTNSLTGTAYDDVINGGAGNDQLIGGAGNDQLTGGAGNDLYIINTSSHHAMGEISDSSGIDELRFSSTIANETLVIFASDIGLERIVIGTGSSTSAVSTAIVALNIDASLAINGLALVGNAGNNDLLGTAFIDNISGGAGNDVIEGGAGNDILNGGIGIDTLTGGIGDDLYIVDNASDQIIESENFAVNGIDLAQSGVSYSLPENVENLTLTGTAAISGAGNEAANILTGNSGANSLTGNDGNDILWGLSGNDILKGENDNDVLIGGAGNDELTGGNGADIFWFNSTANATSNKDVIADFVSGIDKLHFSKSVLSAAGITGQFSVTDGRFWASDTGIAHDLDDRLIYNTTTGALIYDNNGSKAGGGVVLETLGVITHPELVASDIWIV